jgi:cytochrome P450
MSKTTKLTKVQVRVSAAPVDTQRNPTVFPNPYIFDPSRWILDGSDYGTQDMRDAILTWGKGNRACLGKTMASMNIRITIAIVLSRLKVRLANEQTHEDMEHTDHFVLVPKGKKCMLILEHAEE